MAQGRHGRDRDVRREGAVLPRAGEDGALVRGCCQACYSLVEVWNRRLTCSL